MYAEAKDRRAAALVRNVGRETARASVCDGAARSEESGGRRSSSSSNGRKFFVLCTCTLYVCVRGARKTSQSR